MSKKSKTRPVDRGGARAGSAFDRLMEGAFTGFDDLDLGELMRDFSHQQARLGELVSQIPESSSAIRDLVESGGVTSEVAVDQLLELVERVVSDRRRIGRTNHDHLRPARMALDLIIQLEEREQARFEHDWLESLEHDAANSEFDLWLADFSSDHSREPNADEYAVIHAFVFGDGDLDSNQFREQVALDIVIHKMLEKWIDAGASDSLTDFFANRLQLLEGSKNMAASRDKVRRRVNEAAARYAAADGPSFRRFHLAASIGFPTAPAGLFHFSGRHFFDLRDELKRVRRKSHPNLRPVATWVCDTCETTYAPGTAPAEVMPERRVRNDSRLSRKKNDCLAEELAARYVGYVDSLPKLAWEGDSFMCPCWRIKAGVLRPTFDQ